MSEAKGKNVAVAVRDQSSGLLKPVASPAELIEMTHTVSDMIAKTLVEDVDYGAFGNVKAKSLLKPGAEKLCTAFGLVPSYSIAEKEVDHDRENTHKYGKSQGLYRYTVLCDLRDREGTLRGSSFGSCTSMESKYISRPRDSENTVLKMAQKRAFVGATVSCFNLSNRFSQDTDDIHTNEQAASEKPALVLFDKKDSEQEKKLVGLLEKQEVPDSQWDDIAKELHGKPFTPASLKAVIASVTP